MKFEILTKKYHFYMKYMLESTIKTLGPCTNEGAKNFQNLLVWLFLAVFSRLWHFLAYFHPRTIVISFFTSWQLISH